MQTPSASTAGDRDSAELVESVRSPCQPPCNIWEEIARFDANARVETWAGPRYLMTYRVLGSGPPLVLVPGIAGTYQGYACVLNRLAAEFGTIIYDYPGDNRDDGARLNQISHANLVDDLIGLLDHRKIDCAFVFGISFGSTVTLAALARFPDRFRRAAVQGAFAARKFTAAERFALFFGRRVPGAVRSLPFRDQVLAWNNLSEFPRPIRDRWPFYLEENSRTRIAALAHRCDLVAQLDLRSELPTIETEVLLIQGHDDRIVPKRFHEEVRARLPRARTCLLPLVGHQVHYTHPEREAELVAEYFRG